MSGSAVHRHTAGSSRRASFVGKGDSLMRLRTPFQTALIGLLAAATAHAAGRPRGHRPHLRRHARAPGRADLEGPGGAAHRRHRRRRALRGRRPPARPLHRAAGRARVPARASAGDGRRRRRGAPRPDALPAPVREHVLVSATRGEAAQSTLGVTRDRARPASGSRSARPPTLVTLLQEVPGVADRAHGRRRARRPRCSSAAATPTPRACSWTACPSTSRAATTTSGRRSRSSSSAWRSCAARPAASTEPTPWPGSCTW